MLHPKRWDSSEVNLSAIRRARALLFLAASLVFSLRQRMASPRQKEAGLPFASKSQSQAPWRPSNARGEAGAAASTKPSCHDSSSFTGEGAAAMREEHKDYRDDAAYTPTGFGEIGELLQLKGGNESSNCVSRR